jgi:hypothetical protein
MESKLNGARLSHILLLIGLIHFCFWVFVPAALEGSIRLDVAEGVINGPEWEMSYARHPPFSSWLLGQVWHLGPWRYVGLFALGQFLVLSSLLIILKWAKEFDFKIDYFSLQINHNYGVMPFWALTLYATWNALEKNTVRHWIILGLVIGCALWAKYAILHLVIPLIIIALIDPDWRRRILSKHLLFAMITTTIVISPHIVDVLKKGASTVEFATRTQSTSLIGRLGFIGEFILNTILFNLVMVSVVIALIGTAKTKHALRQFLLSLSSSKLDRFLLVASVGPVTIILIAALFGVKPKILWLTPFAISFIMLWARIAGYGNRHASQTRVAIVFGIWSSALIGIYIAFRFLVALTNTQLSYPEMSGPALAELATDYWQRHMTGPIPYLVSFGEQRGRQAIGSIAFDLPYRVQALEENDLEQSPWIDIEDLKKRGALVVAPRNIPENGNVGGLPIHDIETVQRPSLRHSKATATISFGIIKPIAPSP